MIETILKRFYSTQTIKNVISDFSEHPFAEFPLINCEYRCSGCEHNENCYGPQNKDIYEKLMKIIDGNNIKLYDVKETVV